MERFARRKKRKRRRLLLFLIPILLIFTSIFVYGTYLTWKITSATAKTNVELDRGETSDKRDEAIDPALDSFSVLFIGTDERPGESNSRSDALILATFNATDNSIKMVSIPRDSHVDIPDHGYDKITHAHAFGGADLTISTVEELLDIPVDFFVKLNFTAFIEIVDALGGVTVDVPKSFTVQDSKDRANAISLEEGLQDLDGEEALGFVRMRKQDPLGDIGRGERQKQLLKAVIEKSTSIKSLTKYDNMIDSLGDNIKMNLKFSELVSLHNYVDSLGSIETYALEGYNSNNGVYYYMLEDESVQTISTTLKAHLELDSTVASDDTNHSDLN